MIGVTAEKWDDLVCDLVYFYRGGLTFDYANTLTYFELSEIKRRAVNIKKLMG